MRFILSSSNRVWSYSLIAMTKIIAVTLSKAWIHFLLSFLCPPTSTSRNYYLLIAIIFHSFIFCCFMHFIQPHPKLLSPNLYFIDNKLIFDNTDRFYTSSQDILLVRNVIRLRDSLNVRNKTKTMQKLLLLLFFTFIQPGWGFFLEGEILRAYYSQLSSS